MYRTCRSEVEVASDYLTTSEGIGILGTTYPEASSGDSCVERLAEQLKKFQKILVNISFTVTGSGEWHSDQWHRSSTDRITLLVDAIHLTPVPDIKLG